MKILLACFLGLIACQSLPKAVAALDYDKVSCKPHGKYYHSYYVGHYLRTGQFKCTEKTYNIVEIKDLHNLIRI